MHGERLIHILQDDMYHKKAKQMFRWLHTFNDVKCVYYEKEALGMNFQIWVMRNGSELAVYLSFLPSQKNPYKISYNSVVLRHYTEIFDCIGYERMSYNRNDEWVTIYETED